jgi:hypothetical protein
VPTLTKFLIVVAVGCLAGIVVGASAVLFKTARAKSSGEFVRPAAVTLFGIFAMVDAAANFIGWSLDLWAHDTRVVQWGLTGWGRLADAAYYLDYNSLWAGGSAAAGEKSWESSASWASSRPGWWRPTASSSSSGGIPVDDHHQLGLRHALAGLHRQYGGELPRALRIKRLGVTGWWVFDIWYMTPFLTLPWLYALDRRRWSRF